MRGTANRFAAATGVAMLALTGCGGNGQASDTGSGNEVVITVSHASSETSAAGQAVKAWGDYLIEASNGEIDVEYYWSSSLSDPLNDLSSVGSGVADFAIPTYAYTPQDLPAANWTAPLTSVGDLSVYPFATMVGTAASSELFTNHPTLLSEYEDHNVVPFGSLVIDTFPLICTEPVTTLADAEGLNVRSPGALWAAEAEALGMVPVSLPPTEQYEALQRGVIDCTLFSAGAALDFGLFEVAPHLMWVPFSPSNNQAIVGMAAVDQVPEDQRHLLEEATTVHLRAMIEGHLTAMSDAFSEGGKAEELGIEVVMAPELVEALSDHQASVRDEMLEKTPASLSTDEAEDIISSYSSAVEVWNAHLEETGIETSEPESSEEVIERWISGGDLEKFETFWDEFENQ